MKPAAPVTSAFAFLLIAFPLASRPAIERGRLRSEACRARALRGHCGAAVRLDNPPYPTAKPSASSLTLIRRWAYARPYHTSAYRAAALRPWIADYNHRRPHRA